MTDAAWELLSQRAIFAAGSVYFLALLAYLGQWSILRSVPLVATAEVRAEASVGGPAPVAEPETVTVPVPEPQRSEFLGRLGLLLTVLAAAVHVVGVVARGLAADPNRVPWSNMYEFTISWSMVVALLFLAGYRRFSLSWLGPIIAGLNVTVLLLAVRVLYAPVSPLADPLDSYWLVIHVVSAIIATAAFTLGGITSILYLILDLIKTLVKRADRGYLARLPDLARLDLISYRIHAFAFPVWTFAVLITGPIWAYHAWSQYWQWDPKEVWAFITWVVYAAYLHARTTAGWKGRRAAWIAVLGLSTLLFNAVVVNYFVESQHSYAESAPALHSDSPAAFDPVAFDSAT